MGIKLALTGANGNMGKEVLRQTAQSPCVDEIKILLLNNGKGRKFARTAAGLYGKKVKPIFGNIADLSCCVKLAEGADYVVNMAAVIPPTSDHRPDLADECNRAGAESLVAAICSLSRQPKLVHVSTVALYGHRNYLHPWGRVGDPLLPSVFDGYAASKLKGERCVLESGIENWVVLRQTGMLHSRMLTDNMKDGLMFHTCINVPLEWVTARDSGLLVKNLIEKDVAGDLNGFWRRVYNIGGGAANRMTGYETLNGGLELIGGSTERYMKPMWNAIRNFHGLWFSDGDVLNDYLDYQREDAADFWLEILRRRPYYKLAKAVPSRLISKLAIERLLKDINAPRKWIDSGDRAKVRAYFGSADNVGCLHEDWSGYPVLAKGEIADGGVDYAAMLDADKVAENGYLLDHGYDESKPDELLDINDMRSAAAFRGGRCLSESMRPGDLYAKLTWCCHDGHVFEATPYTVLKAGHWCPVCCQPEPWDFDRLAKFIPFFAQVWYDSHARNENFRYFTNARGESECVRFEPDSVSDKVFDEVKI